MKDPRRTGGRTATPHHLLRPPKPLNMEDRDTRSNAPTPSVDTTVANGSTSDATQRGPCPCRKCQLEGCRGNFDCGGDLLADGAGDESSHDVADHNAPDAATGLLERCDITLLHHSHDLIREGGSGKPSQNRSESWTESRRRRKWSAVMPHGPAAPPRRDPRKLRNNRSSSKDFWLVQQNIIGQRIACHWGSPRRILERSQNVAVTRGHWFTLQSLRNRRKFAQLC